MTIRLSQQPNLALKFSLRKVARTNLLIRAKYPGTAIHRTDNIIKLLVVHSSNLVKLPTLLNAAMRFRPEDTALPQCSANRRDLMALKDRLSTSTAAYHTLSLLVKGVMLKNDRNGDDWAKTAVYCETTARYSRHVV
jgi:hypothetical protein